MGFSARYQKTTCFETGGLKLAINDDRGDGRVGVAH